MVLLLGTGPLPLYTHDRLYAFGVRTWHFARCLLDEDIPTVLVTFEFGRKGSEVLSINSSDIPERLKHVALPEPDGTNLEFLVEQIKQLIAQYQPTCMVTAGSNLPAQIAVRCGSEIPLWVDLFGDMMTEVQAKLAFAPASEMDFFLRLYHSLLFRGDRFSTVSEAQKDAVIGQLSMTGRLTGATRDCDLIHVIPVSFDDRTPPPVVREPLLRGRRTPENAFIILWSGGFNTWADIPTLFTGLECAMSANSDIHFAASGGSITGHHEAGFRQFLDLVQTSKHKERFHILGWLPNEAVAGLYAESDLGINVDLDIYEARLGSRCRIVNWMNAGLPCLTTRTTELSKILEANQIGFVFPPSSPEALSEAILHLASNRQGIRDTGTRARVYAEEHFAFGRTIRPLLEWVSNPVVAPDRVQESHSPLMRSLHDLLTNASAPQAPRTSFWKWLRR
ncbi:MAG TPA: glycosyltransferase family 4 protein [bacterium]|nr:glycosyltransferase family 4 protein [bacterium]